MPPWPFISTSIKISMFITPHKDGFSVSTTINVYSHLVSTAHQLCPNTHPMVIPPVRLTGCNLVPKVPTSFVDQPGLKRLQKSIVLHWLGFLHLMTKAEKQRISQWVGESVGQWVSGSVSESSRYHWPFPWGCSMKWTDGRIYKNGKRLIKRNSKKMMGKKDQPTPNGPFILLTIKE